MSQAGTFGAGWVPPSSIVETLTGNSGGAISPSAGNINIVGDGTTATVVGDPSTHTLTISASGSAGISILDGDSGSATGSTVTIAGGTGISTSATGSTVTINSTGIQAVTYVNTTPYVVLPTDYFLDVDCSGGAITIQLPDTPVEGQAFVIKDLTGSAATNNITVTTVSGSTTIDGATSYTIATNYFSIEIIGNSQTAYDIALDYNPAGGIGSITGDTGGPVSGSAINLVAGYLTGPCASGTLSFSGGGTTMTFGVSANSNVGIGVSSLAGVVTDSNHYNNVALGNNSGQTLGFNSNQNCLIGNFSGTAITDGAVSNNGFGYFSLGSLLTGSNNIAIGDSAGNNLVSSESNNIYLNNQGTAAESNVLRIGSATGSSATQLNAAYIAGISAVNVGSVANVVSINTSTNQLGTTAITAGSGISVTPGANTITIASTGGGGISTLDGNSGSATGSTVTITTGASHAQGTALFTGSSATVTLTFSDASSNLGLGVSALSLSAANGFNNIGIGDNAGRSVTFGGDNVFVGTSSGDSVDLGGKNVAVGAGTLNGLTSGSNNIAIGASAGNNLASSESNNIYLNNSGTATESSVLRVGSGTGTGTNQLNAAYVSGIQTIVVTGTPVLVSTSDQLGVAASSHRFKNDIQTMNDESSALHSLRPVTFIWNRDSSPGLKDAPQVRQTGLIAEEVHTVMPNLVNVDHEGKPFTVKYEELPALLLNELQKLKKSHDELVQRIAVLEKKGV